MEHSTTVVVDQFGMRHGSRAESEDSMVGAESLMGFCELVRELGGDPSALLRHASIKQSTLETPGSKVSLGAATELLEESARRLGRSDFGLRLAEKQNGIDIPKPIDRLIANAPTLFDALQCLVSHFRSYTSALRLQFTRDRRRRSYLFSIEFQSDDFMCRRQITEQLLLLTVISKRDLTGGAARSGEVWFTHQRISPASAYAGRFAVPVKFGQPIDGVFYSEEDLRSAVVKRDARLFEAERQKQYPSDEPSVTSQVAQAIVRTLADECCTREQVAGLLGMHPRTLQRRLFTSGIKFEELRDQVRKKLAARYLARSDLSLLDIVNRLGYSEPAVLSRSCRRWFDATPTQLRTLLAREEQKRLQALDS